MRPAPSPTAAANPKRDSTARAVVERRENRTSSCIAPSVEQRTPRCFNSQLNMLPAVLKDLKMLTWREVSGPSRVLGVQRRDLPSVRLGSLYQDAGLPVVQPHPQSYPWSSSSFSPQ